MPRGGGKGGTLLRACSFKLQYTRKNQFSFQNKCFCARETVWRLLQNNNPYNFCPRAETGRCTKRRVRKAVPERLQLTVLSLLLAPLSQRPTCELVSECKQSGNEWTKRAERSEAEWSEWVSCLFATFLKMKLIQEVYVEGAEGLLGSPGATDILNTPS